MFKTETECTPKRVSWWRLVFCALRKRCRFNPSSQVVSSFGLSRPYRRDIADQPIIKALNKYCMVYAVNILIHSHPSLHVSLHTKCRYRYYLIKFSRECYTIWRFGPLRMLYCFSAYLKELSAVLVFMWKQLFAIICIFSLLGMCKKSEPVSLNSGHIWQSLWVHYSIAQKLRAQVVGRSTRNYRRKVTEQ